MNPNDRWSPYPHGNDNVRPVEHLMTYVQPLVTPVVVGRLVPRGRMVDGQELS